MSIFGALAEPNRRAILDLLLDEERPVGAIVDALDIGQPTVSKHLRILREAGLVSMRIDANKRIYGLRVEPFAELEDWLVPYRRRWSRRLDALERLLDSSAPDSPLDNEGDPT
jgi:DNA-binding transcriptional ArsR family regulator